MLQVLKKAKEEGLSLKTTSVMMIIMTLIIMTGLLFSGIRAFHSFRDMEKSTNDYIRMEEAASELMDASDYLTDEAQCYTVMGDRMHLDNYFREVESVRRREHAIAVMETYLPGSPALQKLKDGMAESVTLMEREYYAMKLVLESQGDADLPKALKSIVLSEEDSALEPEQKTALAQRIVHDTAYYEQKNRVRAEMAECVEVLKTGTYGTQQDMTAKFRRDLLLMGALIVIQSLAVFLMMWLTRHLGVNPVLRAVDHIKKDQTIPIVGASEFRYLAGTYNVMYSAYKKSIENLNFKASHDELTGVYNRAGYELIRTSVDLSSTAMLLFDADTFKEINDTFGHETGDRVLKKISAALKNNFRSDDYICRIGGDEFVVFMVHISGDPGKLIEDKVIRINQELSNVADGLPPITLSAGVSFDPENTDPAEMFRQADIALYYVKDNGRNDCCFYSDALKGKSKPE